MKVLGPNIKCHMVKLLRKAISTINNVVPGMLVLNTEDSDRPTVYNGSDWRGLAYTEEGSKLLNTDSIILTSFDEFGYDTQIQSSILGDKYLNAIYEWLVLNKKTPKKTDFSYTIEEDLSRIGQVTNCLFWVNWFCQGNENSSKIRPALQDNVKIDIDRNDWIAGGYDSNSTDIINIQTDYPISGSQNDASLLRGMLAIQERGYKPGFIPVTRYIDIQLKKEYWRGTITWNDISAFNSWVDDYIVFYKHYINLFYDNGIDLGISYLGSEMPELSKSTFNSTIQRKWVDTLIELASFTKEKFPNSTVTYASDWTEYRYNLDRLWVDKNLDRIGIEFYLPVLLKHSNNQDIINRETWSGEGLDYYLSGHISNERFALTTNGQGKVNLIQSSQLAKNQQLNNWREWLNNPHYLNKRDGAIADASPFFNNDVINQIYDENSLSIMVGTAENHSTIDVSVFSDFESGPNRRLFNKNTWLYTNGGSYGQFQFSDKALTDNKPIDEFQLVIDFDLDINATHSSSFPRLIRFNNWLDIFLDTGVLKANFKQADANGFLNIEPINENYNGSNQLVITIKNNGTDYSTQISYGGSVIAQTTFGLTQNNIATIFSSPENYVGSFAGTSDFMIAKYYKIKSHFKVGDNYYGGTYNFEDEVFGVRNEYDARFELDREIPVMATELGVASINGSLVEPNVFPLTDRSGSGYIPETNVRDYWETVANYGLKIGNISGPYGSNFYSDELHQKVGLTTIIPSLKEAGVKETALYNLDARYFKGFKGVYEERMWYEDAGDHIYNHALNGKNVLGYQNKIYESIKPN